MDSETGLVNFEYRMYDPRLGRFFRIDPLVNDYPELTPYQFSSNRPIDYREIEGMEGTPATDAAFQVGLTNALASDLIFGIGREDAADIYPKSYSNQAAYLRGQIAGDIVAIFMSGIEIDAGYGQLITAGLLAVNIEGAPVTEPAALATALGATVTIVHGSLVAGAASKGLIDSKNQLNEIEGSSSSGSSGRNSQETEYRNTKHTDNRHVDRKKYPDKSKYSKPNQKEKLQNKTIKNPDKVTTQRNGRVVYEKDLGRKIGTNGETSHKVVVDPKKKKIITSYPQKPK